MITENKQFIKLTQDNRKMHDYDDNQYLHYQPIQYINLNIVPQLFGIKLKKRYVDSTVKSLYYLFTENNL